MDTTALKELPQKIRELESAAYGCGPVKDAAATLVSATIQPFVERMEELERELHDSRNEQIRLTGEVLGEQQANAELQRERDRLSADYEIANASLAMIERAAPDLTIQGICDLIRAAD